MIGNRLLIPLAGGKSAIVPYDAILLAEGIEGRHNANLPDAKSCIFADLPGRGLTTLLSTRTIPEVDAEISRMHGRANPGEIRPKSLHLICEFAAPSQEGEPENDVVAIFDPASVAAVVDQENDQASVTIDLRGHGPITYLALTSAADIFAAIGGATEE